MVTVLKIRENLPFLFSSEPVASLETLLLAYKGKLPNLAVQILKKDELTFYEKKYLSWLRHSLAFKTRQTSPRKILESWTLDVTEMLSDVWVKTFSPDDPLVIAFLGKLGSGELNLSSDIDVIFFGEETEKLGKIRSFMSSVGDLNQIPSGFKVDLDLRPGGASAPLICSPSRLGDHLWNSSDPWERYSYTRMSIQLGSKAISDRVREIRDKFCYRKYLSSDFFHSFVQMRKKYRVNRNDGTFHIKLGPGGIRDIELFVQTFQILHGGKDIKFRGLSTFQLLSLFIRENINKEIFEKLQVSYVLLRQAEGEVHALKESGGFDWKKNADNPFDKALYEGAETAHKIINDYINSSLNVFGSSKLTLEPSNFRDRIEDILIEQGTDLKDSALRNLDQYFLSKKNHFKSYYNAILSQKKMKEAFVDLLKYSDYGCQVLSRRPSLLDVFFLRMNTTVHDSEDSFLNSLSDVKMVQRILASSEFKKNTDVKTLGEKVTSSYEMILKEIMKPEDGVDLLFFGKMATREMGLSSDLDFIMVTDDEKFSVKKARDLYKRLSYLTIFGPLIPYDIDGGPMGKASPLLMSWSAVETFLKEKAEPWQKLMYLKQRRLFSDREMLYVEDEMEKDELEKLFQVLQARLKVSPYKKDTYKLGFGGLFHIEFVIGALLLRFGIQPQGSLKMSELMEKLEMITYERDILRKLTELYYEIACIREEILVNGVTDYTVDEKLLTASHEALDLLCDKYLYGIKAEKV